MEEFEFQYYTPSQYHHNLVHTNQQGQSQQQGQPNQQFLQFQTNNSNQTTTNNQKQTLTLNDSNLRCSSNNGPNSVSNTNDLSSTIGLLTNLNDTDQLNHHNQRLVNINTAQNGQNKLANSNNSTSNQSNQSNNNRKHTNQTASVVYAMDRLSPYGNFDDSRSNTNLTNLTLDQIFKSNGADVVVNSNESILLLNQNLECLQKYQNQASSLGSSTSPSTNSTLSNLDSNGNQINSSSSSTSSPQSSSPSSTNEANSNFGTILNSALTPPPDNGSISLTNDTLIFNPFNIKVENIQLLDCNMNPSQQQQQQQNQNEPHSHPTSNLVSLVPPSSTSSTMNPILQQVVPNMMNLISPSKPTNISELSNSSMVSSSSGSSTIDSSINTQQTSSSSRRQRVSKQMQDLQKDCKYFERRKRNNVAAKKSRDARKQREDEIAIRASFLEKENSILKAQLQTLKDEAQQLRILLAQKKSNQNMLSNGMMSNSCANCSNCSSMNTAKTLNGAYNVNPSLNQLGQMNTYEHQSDTIGLDNNKLTVQIGQNQSTNSLNNGSIYIQHQTQHRHQII